MYWYYGNFGMRGNPDEGSLKIVRLFFNHSFLPNNCKSLVRVVAHLVCCSQYGKVIPLQISVELVENKKNPSIVTFDVFLSNISFRVRTHLSSWTHDRGRKKTENGQWSQEGQPLKRLQNSENRLSWAMTHLKLDTTFCGRTEIVKINGTWMSEAMMQRLFTLWDHSFMCGYNYWPAVFKYNSDSDVVVLKYGGVWLSYVGNLLDVHTPCTSCSTLVFSRIRQNKACFSITACWYECFFESLSS